jgi:virginiamycin B lyase
MMRRVMVGAVLVGAIAGLLFSASPAQALSVQEFPTTPGTGPDSIVLGPDGNQWFTEGSANAIGRITSGGVVTEFPVTTPNSLPGGIAVGSDGNLWFTEPGANKIGRISPSAPNTITEFPITATPNSGPGAIAAGPDGNMWFTENGGNKIGQILTASPNTITDFAVPNCTGCGLNSITAGSDGKLWFTEFSASKIGRFDPKTQKFSKFGLGLEDSQPQSITTGSDGDVWFTMPPYDLVTRMDTSGNEQSFAFPDKEPLAVAPGPDGDIWVTEQKGNAVVQIDTSGSFLSASAIPTPNSEPSSISAGGDGNMWFTELGADQIGRVLLPHLNLRYISYVPNRFFIPNVALLHNRGDTVSWLMLNPGTQGITDASGMGLYGSHGRVSIGETYSFAFIGAGTYAYNDSARAGAAAGSTAAGQVAGKGKVKVPITVQLVPGTLNQAQVIWASAEPPRGFVFDVQVKVPGSDSFVDWRVGVAGPTAVFGPGDPLYAGPGNYRFRSRIRNTANGAASGYSAPKSIVLT